MPITNDVVGSVVIGLENKLETTKLIVPGFNWSCKKLETVSKFDKMLQLMPLERADVWVLIIKQLGVVFNTEIVEGICIFIFELTWSRFEILNVKFNVIEEETVEMSLFIWTFIILFGFGVIAKKPDAML